LDLVLVKESITCGKALEELTQRLMLAKQIGLGEHAVRQHAHVTHIKLGGPLADLAEELDVLVLAAEADAHSDGRVRSDAIDRHDDSILPVIELVHADSEPGQALKDAVADALPLRPV
jgi:hypothetical protein